MTMHFIASSGTLSTSAVAFNFTGIPQTYTHLQLRIFGRASHATTESYTLLQFNYDSAATNYSEHHLYGTGASALANGAANQTYMNVTVFTGANALTNNFGVGIIDIFDYTSTTKAKSIKWIGGHDNNGTGRAESGSGLWFKTPEAITTIGCYTANIAAGSRFDLYGITSSPTTGA